MDTLFIDLGTTGIAFGINEFNSTQSTPVAIYTPELSYLNTPILQKIPTTLHVLIENDSDMDNVDQVVKQSYLGDEMPKHIERFRNQHPTVVDYMFHGLKTYVYKLKTEVSPCNNPKKQFDSLKIFSIVLHLVKLSIQYVRGTKSMEMRIVFLIPANADADLMDFIKPVIVDVFSYLKDEQKYNYEKWFIFVKEPVAATKYAVENIIKKGSKIVQHERQTANEEIIITVQNDYSNIAIIDMGAGTCDFNLVKYFPNIINEQQQYVPFCKTSASFIGGFNVDKFFLRFLSQMFSDESKTDAEYDSIDIINLDPNYINQILNKFIKQKQFFNNDSSNNCSFDIDIPQSLQFDQFAQLNEIFVDIGDLNNKDTDFVAKCKQIFEQHKFSIPQKVFKICFDEVLISVREYIEDFFQSINTEQQDVLDHIIFVGGFSQSQYVRNQLNQVLPIIYKRAFKTQIVPQIHFIETASIAIISGATMLLQNDQLIKNYFIVQEDVYFLQQNQEIQLYKINESLEFVEKRIDLKNLTASNSDAKTAIARFKIVNSKKQVTFMQFAVNIQPGVKYQAQFDCSQGHRLIMYAPNSEPEVYNYILGTVSQQSYYVYILVDVSKSMEKYVQDITNNLEIFMNNIQKKKFIVKFIFYSDFCYFPRNQLDNEMIYEYVDTDTTGLHDFLQKQIELMHERADILNDECEHILPALERAVATDPKKQKIIVILGDSCAHTHIGCCCHKTQNKYNNDNVDRGKEVNKHYSCTKCFEQQMGNDFVLDNSDNKYDKVKLHKTRWENLCKKLQHTLIIFVPVNQEEKVDIIRIDKHIYDLQGCSILKTHRMMHLMGCQKLRTLPNLTEQGFASQMSQQVAELIVGNE